jgi:hypothetical protein
MRRTPMVLALAVATLGAASARAQIPGLGDAARVLDRVPGLSSFLEGDPPITTSLDDAVTEVAFLDGSIPLRFWALDALPRDAGGGFRLVPGAFAFESESYCLKAGTAGPGGGDGYLYAPLSGPKGGIVRAILQNSVAHPEIPQRDIQVLLWAIIARTEFDEMPSDMQRAARALLTRDQVDDLDDGALGAVPESVMREAMRQLPPVARQVFQAEARLRSMISRGSTSFTELERVAVLSGAVTPPEGSRPVPDGRWSYHPDGYFVRFFPEGYSRTRIEIVVPPATLVRRDAGGRIVEITDEYGRRLEMLYEGSSSIAAFAFLDPAAPAAVAQPIAHREPGSRFPDLASRSGTAEAERAEWHALAGRITGRPSGSFDPALLLELAQIRRALGAADPDAAEGALDLVTNAWQHEFCRQVGGCATGAPSGAGRAGGAGWLSAAPVFDPSGTVGVPGNRGRQRLGQSGRGSSPPGLGSPDRRPVPPLADGEDDADQGDGEEEDRDDEPCAGERAGVERERAQVDMVRSQMDAIIEERNQLAGPIADRLNRMSELAPRAQNEVVWMALDDLRSKFVDVLTGHIPLGGSGVNADVLTNAWGQTSDPTGVGAYTGFFQDMVDYFTLLGGEWEDVGELAAREDMPATMEYVAKMMEVRNLMNQGHVFNNRLRNKQSEYEDWQRRLADAERQLAECLAAQGGVG